MTAEEICSDCLSRERPCNGRCACLADPESRDIVELIQIRFCPLNKFKRLASLASTPQRQQPANAFEIEGPKLWGQLHCWATSGDISRPLLWLAKFTERLGCGRCTDDWKQWLLDHPPDIESRDSLFRWTVAAHNAVNARLGKPEMTEGAARQRWR